VAGTTFCKVCCTDSHVHMQVPTQLSLSLCSRSAVSVKSIFTKAQVYFHKSLLVFFFVNIHFPGVVILSGILVNLLPGTSVHTPRISAWVKGVASKI
jgi:hypothetical protein